MQTYYKDIIHILVIMYEHVHFVDMYMSAWTWTPQRTIKDEFQINTKIELWWVFNVYIDSQRI